MKKVLVTYRDIPGGHLLDTLAESFEVATSPSSEYMSREQLLGAVRDVHGLVSLLSERIDGELMDTAPNLEIVANYAVGYNNVDVDTATSRGIMVTNTPDVVTDATADLAWALLMAVARDIVIVDKYVRSGSWIEWRPEAFIAADIAGTTLGIIGIGRIGQAMARRAAGFDMRVLYYDPLRLDLETERTLGVKYVAFDDLLQQADFVTLHVPLGSATLHLIDADALARMKPTAYLINASRGPIVDEKALVTSLTAGTIAGAGLDVYENEPLLEPGLAELENVVLVPHLGANSRRTRDRMAGMTVENLSSALAGGIPPNLVNPDVLKNRRGD
ncbi:2-hydroxyacid dehydrogenase [Chloroflexota bacterium]